MCVSMREREGGISLAGQTLTRGGNSAVCSVRAMH